MREDAVSEPFLAQITIGGFNFNPRGWAQCDGQILPINQNQSLFSLLGTTYGGDGRTNFALPDLRGRVPIHKGNSNTSGSTDHALGQKSGAENQVLNINQVPAHDHSLQASGFQASVGDPNGSALAGQALFSAPFYATPPAAADSVNMHPATISNAGAGQGHNNMQPYLAVNYIIAITGLFPSRN